MVLVVHQELQVLVGLVVHLVFQVLTVPQVLAVLQEQVVHLVSQE